MVQTERAAGFAGQHGRARTAGGGVAHVADVGAFIEAVDVVVVDFTDSAAVHVAFDRDLLGVSQSVLRDKDLLADIAVTQVQPDVAETLDRGEVIDGEQREIELVVFGQQFVARDLHGRDWLIATANRRLVIEPDLGAVQLRLARDAMPRGKHPVIAPHPPRGAFLARTGDDHGDRVGALVVVRVAPRPADGIVQLGLAAVGFQPVDGKQVLGGALAVAGLDIGQVGIDLEPVAFRVEGCQVARQPDHGRIAGDRHGPEGLPSVVAALGVHGESVSIRRRVPPGFGGARIADFHGDALGKFESAEMQLDELSAFDLVADRRQQGEFRIACPLLSRRDGG